MRNKFFLALVIFLIGYLFGNRGVIGENLYFWALEPLDGQYLGFDKEKQEFNFDVCCGPSSGKYTVSASSLGLNAETSVVLDIILQEKQNQLFFTPTWSDTPILYLKSLYKNSPPIDLNKLLQELFPQSILKEEKSTDNP